ncbi:hypothetical protein L489_3337, partial [Bordetella bronchiseptica 00-P-2730]
PQALVQIDLAARRVTVEGAAAAEPVAQAIRAAGYSVQAA